MLTLGTRVFTWPDVVRWRADQASADADRATDSAPGPALSDDSGRELGWVDLDRAVDTRAAGWIDAGLNPSDVVALIARNSAAVVVEILALNRVGATPLMVNWRLKPTEVAALTQRASLAAVSADAHSTDLGEAALEASPGAFGVALNLSGERGLHDTPWGELPATARPSEARRHPSTSDEPFVILHTSGTTGIPKLIPVSHAASLRGAAARLVGRVTPLVGDLHLRCMPMFHIAGINPVTLGLLSGGHTHLLGGFDPEAVLDQLRTRPIRWSNLVPTALEALVAACERHHVTVPCPTLIEVDYGGSPIPTDVLTRAIERLGCDFRQVYGMTEAGSEVATLDPLDHSVDSPNLGATGRIGVGWEHRIVDPNDETNEVPTGETGELHIRGETLFAGYLGDDDQTSAAFTPDGFYRTGDLVRIDGHGYLHVVGRTHDMIITGGENVYPAEVENVLRRHAAVDDVVVVGLADPRWGQRVHAAVKPATDHLATDAELIAFAREHLAHFKCPSTITRHTSLPTNATGKVLRRVLRDELLTDDDAGSIDHRS